MVSVTLFALCWFLAGCSPRQAETVKVFAAASTRDVLEQIKTEFETETGIPIELNTGPSSHLAREIERGARADLFLSADEEWATYIAGKGLVAERHNLLTNRLLVVVPSASAFEVRNWNDLQGPSITRLALAGASVPAGHYARQALENAGIWHQVKKRIIEGGDVRAALAYVARGEAEAGIVYATDIAGVQSVRQGFEIDSRLHQPILYPLLLIKRDPPNDSARRLFEYLSSTKAFDIYKRAGFGLARQG